MDMTTSSSNPMEVELKSYGSFKGQRNPFFEPSHQIGGPMSKIFYEENNHDKISNELAGDLMEESNEGISIDASQIGIQGQGLMAITPQVASHHKLYEGNPI